MDIGAVSPAGADDGGGAATPSKIIAGVDEFVHVQSWKQIYESDWNSDWIMALDEDEQPEITQSLTVLSTEMSPIRDDEFLADPEFSCQPCDPDLLPCCLDFGGQEDDDEVGAVNVDSGEKLLMVDSGAARTVFKVGEFRAQVREEVTAGLRTITGQTIKKYGSQKPLS